MGVFHVFKIVQMVLNRAKHHIYFPKRAVSIKSRFTYILQEGERKGSLFFGSRDISL